MAVLKKLVGVTLVVVLVTAVTLFVLRPSATPNPSAVVGQPGTNDEEPAANEPPLPERLSNGPNHPVCLKPNEHIPDHAQQRGANWYRFFGNPGCAFPALLALVLR